MLVGPDRTLFSVHKDLICHHSPYFDAAFNGPFKESSDGQITLEEAAPFTFGLFLHWLYTGLVPFAKDADNDDDDDDKEKEEADDDEDEAQPPSVDESGLEHVQGSSGGVETDADSEQKARSGARETALDVRLTPLYVFAERYDAPVSIPSTRRSVSIIAN